MGSWTWCSIARDSPQVEQHRVTKLSFHWHYFDCTAQLAEVNAPRVRWVPVFSAGGWLFGDHMPTCYGSVLSRLPLNGLPSHW